MLTVCNFHYVRTHFNAPFPSIFGVTPSQFQNQLEELARMGKFINQNELIRNADTILNSKENFNLITFDDGLKEQFEIAKPILDKLKIPAIYFINSINFIEKEVSQVHKIHLLRSLIKPTEFLAFVNNIFDVNETTLTTIEIEKAVKHYNYDDYDSACLKYLLNFKLPSNKMIKVINTMFKNFFDESEIVNNLYMNEAQLLELSDQNSLGNHTHNHLALGLLSEENIQAEIVKTKEFINNFGAKFPHTISYPYGSAEACQYPVSHKAKQVGYQIGFTMQRGSNSISDDKLLLKRFDCNDLPGGKNHK
ncbi:MAG: polysaccharide deacetylase family protein [Flavobacterium sp.]|nr:polysaccharide deacetylase family protein [Flavobacterium sp.]